MKLSPLSEAEISQLGTPGLQSRRELAGRGIAGGQSVRLREHFGPAGYSLVLCVYVFICQE